MKKLMFATLCAAAVALVLPHPSHAQAVKGMTLDQYMLMQERVDAFCAFYYSPASLPSLPPNGVRVPNGLQTPGGTTMYYVYSKEEVQALIKHCQSLMALLAKVKP